MGKKYEVDREGMVHSLSVADIIYPRRAFINGTHTFMEVSDLRVQGFFNKRVILDIVFGHSGGYDTSYIVFGDFDLNAFIGFVLYQGKIYVGKATITGADVPDFTFYMRGYPDTFYVVPAMRSGIGRICINAETLSPEPLEVNRLAHVRFEWDGINQRSYINDKEVPKDVQILLPFGRLYHVISTYDGDGQPQYATVYGRISVLNMTDRDHDKVLEVSGL